MGADGLPVCVSCSQIGVKLERHSWSSQECPRHILFKVHLKSLTRNGRRFFNHELIRFEQEVLWLHLVACANQIQQLSASCKELSQSDMQAKSTIGNLLSKLKETEVTTENLLRGQKEFYERQIRDLELLISKQRSLLRPNKQNRRYRNCANECVQKMQLLEEENAFLSRQAIQIRTSKNSENEAFQKNIKELNDQIKEMTKQNRNQEEELKILRDDREQLLDKEVSKLDGKIMKKLTHIESLLEPRSQDDFPPLNPEVEFVDD